MKKRFASFPPREREDGGLRSLLIFRFMFSVFRERGALGNCYNVNPSLRDVCIFHRWACVAYGTAFPLLDLIISKHGSALFCDYQSRLPRLTKRGSRCVCLYYVCVFRGLYTLKCVDRDSMRYFLTLKNHPPPAFNTASAAAATAAHAHFFVSLVLFFLPRHATQAVSVIREVNVRYTSLTKQDAEALQAEFQGTKIVLRT